ncbi:MAG: hypothetical protein RIG77_08625 [Cyclobacteriaceae bacterium]
MIKYLNKILWGLDGKRLILENLVKMHGHPVHSAKASRQANEELNTLKIIIADLCLLHSEVSELVHILSMVKADCVAELNGTYYQDRAAPYIKPWMVYEPEKDSPYIKILWRKKRGYFDMSIHLRSYLEKFPSLDMVPEGISVQRPDKPLSGSCCAHHQKYAGPRLPHVSMLELYDLTIEMLVHLGKRKGSLAEIIRLVE